MTTLTAYEIFHYKLTWMRKTPCYYSCVHCDYRRDAIEWCKNNLEKQQWKEVYFTDIYQDTFYFETDEFKRRFIDEFILPRHGHR